MSLRTIVARVAKHPSSPFSLESSEEIYDRFICDVYCVAGIKRPLELGTLFPGEKGVTRLDSSQ